MKTVFLVVGKLIFDNHQLELRTVGEVDGLINDEAAVKYTCFDDHRSRF